MEVWIDLINKGGVLAGLLIVILTGVREDWVSGKRFRKVEERADYWQGKCWDLISQMGRSTGVAEEVTQIAKEAIETRADRDQLRGVVADVISELADERARGRQP